MSAIIRRLRPATTVRLALSYVRRVTSHRPLVVGIAVLCTASVLFSFMTQNDDVLPGDAVAAKDSFSPSLSDNSVDGGSSSVLPPRDVYRPPSPLFEGRPLVLLTLSYHAAPIYDLMDQLQPLGVRFIERGINAYACRYFSTCRQDDLLEACLHSTPIVSLHSILLTFLQYSADVCTMLMESLVTQNPSMLVSFSC